MLTIHSLLQSQSGSYWQNTAFNSKHSEYAQNNESKPTEYTHNTVRLNRHEFPYRLIVTPY